MNCPVCGAAARVIQTRDLPYAYKNASTSIPVVTGAFCPTCGDAVLDASQSTRVSGAMLAFNKQVNAAIVDPGFITTVRKKLDLDQREATEIFGGGVNAFCRIQLISKAISAGMHALHNHPNHRLNFAINKSQIAELILKSQT